MIPSEAKNAGWGESFWQGRWGHQGAETSLTGHFNCILPPIISYVKYFCVSQLNGVHLAAVITKPETCKQSRLCCSLREMQHGPAALQAAFLLVSGHLGTWLPPGPSHLLDAPPPARSPVLGPVWSLHAAGGSQRHAEHTCAALHSAQARMHHRRSWKQGGLGSAVSGGALCL